jgi:NAD(P)-dependent dehydrogenase (short-subunit alcohol dehydrogenase family)
MMNNNMFSLDNKNIILTGGNGHLGHAIAEGLINYGAKVFILDRSIATFESVFSKEILNTGKLLFIECDIEKTGQVSSSFKNIYSKFNSIDVLINNAIYLKGNDPENISDEEWAYSVDGCLNSVYRCIREVIPFMKKQKSGKIINMSSMYGIVSPDMNVYENYPQFLNPPHYGAAKAGVIQLTKYFASYLGKFNINVNTVTPGPFPSKSVQVQTGFIEELKKKTLLDRIGTPEDLQGAFVFLSSDCSSYITGQNIVVDGGWTTI